MLSVRFTNPILLFGLLLALGAGCAGDEPQDLAATGDSADSGWRGETFTLDREHPSTSFHLQCDELFAGCDFLFLMSMPGEWAPTDGFEYMATVDVSWSEGASRLYYFQSRQGDYKDDLWQEDEQQSSDAIEIGTYERLHQHGFEIHSSDTQDDFVFTVSHDGEFTEPLTFSFATEVF